MVEAFPTERADEAFRDRVRPWSSGRGADDPDVGTGEHGVKGGGELAVSVADQESEPVGAVAEVDEQVAGLLGDPDAGGMGGDPGEVHATTAVFDHDEDVEAAQEDGVDVGEIDREDGVGLRAEELRPGWASPSWRGIESGVLQDFPDGRGGHGMAEADQLALDAPVAPAGILAGHPQYEGPDRRCGGWSAWSSVRVGPAAGDELGVPAQQRSGRHQPQLAQRGRQQPAQRAEHGAVEPGAALAGGCCGAARRPRDAASGSRRPWRRRSGRAAPASSAREQASGRRVRRPQRAIMLGWLWTVTVRSPP